MSRQVFLCKLYYTSLSASFFSLHLMDLERHLISKTLELVGSGTKGELSCFQDMRYLSPWI